MRNTLMPVFHWKYSFGVLLSFINNILFINIKYFFKHIYIRVRNCKMLKYKKKWKIKSFVIWNIFCIYLIYPYIYIYMYVCLLILSTEKIFSKYESPCSGYYLQSNFFLHLFLYTVAYFVVIVWNGITSRHNIGSLPVCNEKFYF